MRRFEPEKELRKIQNRNRNKVIFGVVALLIIIAIGSTYALYQVRYSKRIIYTKVGEISKDLNLAVYVDGTKQKDFPDQDIYYFDKVVCDNNSEWEFDYDNWKLMLKTDHQDKCNVYFTKNYRDRSGANAPELYQGLIPIYFNDGKIYIADVEKEWYDYDKHNWGNAALIDNTNEQIRNKFYNEDGTLKINDPITEEDILQMYVWIPRYKYQLFNVVVGETAEEQIINIKFESGTTNTGDIECTYKNLNNGTIEEKCLNKEGAEASNGEWYTHPAFTFKGTLEENGTELPGIWVGKFEPSDPTDPNSRTNGNEIKEVTILPNKTSIVSKTISIMFNAERAIETNSKYYLNEIEIDTHMMKNMEWGAVAYLTQSKYGIYTSDGTGCVIEGMNKENCEVWINNTSQGAGTTNSGKNNIYGGTYTGCVGASVSATVQWNTADDGSVAKCDADKVWNTGGVKASTTGNMYGIYDMVGGTLEYVMGVIENEDGTEPYYASSGFNKNTIPDAKYYDLYTFSDSDTSHARGFLGDSTRETLKDFGNSRGGWFSSVSAFPYVSSDAKSSWFDRGGRYDVPSYSSIYAFSAWAGTAAVGSISFRSVLSAG